MVKEGDGKARPAAKGEPWTGQRKGVLLNQETVLFCSWLWGSRSPAETAVVEGPSCR